jgi:anti-sigma regulatory factor (Ser/Thr protein kinase)
VATAVIPVDDASRVGEVRRAARDLAHAEGLDESLTGNLALVSTEICTNLLKHARGGEVFLTPLSDRNASGVEILAIDRGPGMSDLPRCLVDGYSSGQSPGTGLGAITRLSQEFDIYTERDKGTVLVSQIRAGARAVTSVGGIVKPIAGEAQSGDAWAVVERDGTLVLIVADGLGHGVDAARASAEAISAFRRATDLTPTSVLQQVHGALRSTRGAAVAVAHIHLSDRRVRYSGIGNISGVICQAGKSVFMVSHSGTAGYHSPRFQEFSYPLPEGALVIMHSDGLNTSWKLDSYPGLRRSHPSVIAGVLYRDATRVRDDVSVVVAKLGGAG